MGGFTVAFSLGGEKPKKHPKEAAVETHTHTHCALCVCFGCLARCLLRLHARCSNIFNKDVGLSRTCHEHCKERHSEVLGAKRQSERHRVDKPGTSPEWGASCFFRGSFSCLGFQTRGASPATLFPLNICLFKLTKQRKQGGF